MPENSLIPSMPVNEDELRARLGIPQDAQTVLFFAESSHWDPDWMWTSEEYYTRLVAPALNLALSELEAEERRVYSVECMFFLRMYWDRNPQKRETIRRLVNTRRLRLTSTGVTTADTLIPESEILLREFLQGQEWLIRNGMEQRPRLAYYTDSFGPSPCLPSLLRAAGFDRTALTRLDGMYFIATDYDGKRGYPRPGSSAELLTREKTSEFVWRDPHGAEVLCHWNTFNYGMGDMLASHGISRTYMFPYFINGRSDRNIARRVSEFTRQLKEFSRLPYLLCPIGTDFVEPIKGLLKLLDRYNEKMYPSTGIWTVNAGLDDFLDLVECHKEKLPTLQMDPNPYWTGFYTARPSLKQACQDLGERLLLLEKLSFQEGHTDLFERKSFQHAWWVSAVSDHHDFITGTSPDRVVEREQMPWLEEALDFTERELSKLTPPAEEPATSDPLPEWTQDGNRISVKTPLASLTCDGLNLSSWSGADGKARLRGASAEVIRYRDSGGLWRMGMEYGGGVFREIGTGQAGTALVSEQPDGLEWGGSIQVDGELLERKMSVRPGEDLLWMQLHGKAADARTVTLRFRFDLQPDTLEMDQPGGVVTRTLKRIYEPTFWPFQHFFHVRDSKSGRGAVIYTRYPSAACCKPDGIVEVIALRNANRERAYGFLTIPANPATGHERKAVSFTCALGWTEQGGWKENGFFGVVEQMKRGPWEKPEMRARQFAVRDLVKLDRKDVRLLAVKPATFGDGWILHLDTAAAYGNRLSVRIPGRTIGAASLCDAREQDLQPLMVENGQVRLTPNGTLSVIRVRLD